MRHYLLAGAWASTILASHCGWGWAFRRAIGLHAAPGWGVDAALGVAITIAIGGLLNALRAISSRKTVLFTLAGAALTIARLINSHSSILSNTQHLFHAAQTDRLLAVGLLLLTGATLIHSAATLVNDDLETMDDFWAYMAFPKKMLQTGSFARDPFSERRLVSSLGGNVLLQSQVLSVLDVRSLNIADSGQGLLVLLGVTGGILQQLDVSAPWSVLLLAVIALMPPFRTNLTSAVLPAALLLAMLSIMGAPPASPDPRTTDALAIGLIAAALCSLKTTLIPVTVLLVAAHSLAQAIMHGPAATLGGVALCSAISLLVLLPWMHSLRQSSGTLLYPILGKGYHLSACQAGTAPGDRPDPRRMAIGAGLAMALVAAGVGCELILPGRAVSHSLMRSTSLYLLITGLATGTLCLASGGYAWLRYTFPQVFSALVALLCVLAGASHHGPDRAQMFAAAGTFLLAVALLGASCSYLRPWGPLTHLRRSLAHVTFGLHNRALDPPDAIAQAQALQHAIPPGVRLLERVNRPDLLDFARNEVLICDWPGMAAPPPGMPVSAGAEALAAFLLSHSIRYVAYAYGNECGMSPRSLAWTKRNQSAWIAIELDRAIQFQRTLMELSKTRQHIYDDGDHFVLDLAAHHPST